MYLIWVDDGVQVHHRALRNRTMPLLLANCPRSSFARQRHSVSIHKPPGTIDELPNDINWARVERSQCCLLCIVKCLLLNFPISVLESWPIPNTEGWSSVQWNLVLIKLTISIGSSSQWNFGRNIHSWPASLIAMFLFFFAITYEK